MSDIKFKVGIISGKGGVGKSTITSLLAVELANKGYKVGVLDLDITGSSIPKIFGIYENPSVENKKIIPVETKNGIKILSVGLMLDNPTDPILWRGPLITKAINQFVKDVEWGSLDFLISDFPPGTSDVFISSLQLRLVRYAFFVTTPQELSNFIVEKTIKAAEKLNAKILGIIENMSYVKCPKCGEIINLFGESKTEVLKEKYGTDIVSKIPIDREIIDLADKGKIEEYKKDYLKNVIKILEEKLKERI